jgi:diguanylate cyclase (GGDEF)-like protein
MSNANPNIRSNMRHHSFAAGITEKRRYVRKATIQTAQVRFGEGAGIPSEIRDYCQTGLYVAFPGDRTPDAAIPALAGTHVGVGFSVGQGDATRSYQLNGWVARVSPGGVGVFVPAMPETALQALRAASARLAMPDVVQVGPNLSPQQVQALQQECTSLFRSFLDAVMQEFFLQSMERLAQAGRDELSFLERSRYEYGAQELMQRRSRIEDDFFNAIRERIQHVGPIAETDNGAPGTNTLTLVDEAEFEDWLNLSAVIKQIEADITPQLNEFEQRYSRLAGMPIDRKNNPFGPEMIGRTFQGAIQGLDFTNPMRTVLYKGLGRALSSHGPALYRQLNQTLASLQPVAPTRDKSRAEPVTASAAAPPTKSDKPKPDLAEIADTLNKLYKQDQTSNTQTPESAEYSLDRILATLNQSQRRTTAGVPRAPATRTAQQGGLPAAHPAAARPEVLQMVGRLQHAAQQMGGHDARVRQQPGTHGGGGVALPEANLRELLAALEGLPLANQAAPAGGPVQPTLAEQIDARIVSTDGHALRLAADHRQILDTTSALFGRARDDFVPSSEVESLVKRLERPLLKLALQDTRFPSNPDHPARQVLNFIEQYAVAADDKGKFFDAKLQRFLYLLVDRVCSRADEDPGVFEMVRDNLEKVLLPILQIRRARIARLQEASEGRERIRAARTRVNAALEQRLAGREVPGMLLRLLDAGWRQYLVLLEMRQGPQGEAWDAGLAVLDRLFAWLGPAHADASRTTEAALALLSEIERALATVNVDANLLAALIDELGDRLVDTNVSTSAAGQATVLVPLGKLAVPQVGGGDIEAAHARLVDRLRVGDWWDFIVEGGRVPMQLIWISQPPASCAFANRSATNKLEFTLAELSRQLRNGLAKPGKDLDLPLMERSEHALFDETYQSLVHQAIHDPVTGLLNRKGFMQSLNQQASPDETDKAHVVGIIEFDQIRLIHNTCGEEAAESLTRSLASEIRTLIGPETSLAAFRDDMLAFLLPNRSRSGGCPAVDTLLNQVKDYHFQHEQHSYRIGFNIGLSEYDPAQFSAAEAIRRADSACITAKTQGRNRMQVYEQDSPQLQNQESLMDWAGRLDSFLQGSGLYLRCQKVMPISTDLSLLPYYEILLGIDNEAGHAINPSHFIPAVEHLKRSHEVDIWVMRKVFEWIGENQAIFASVGGFAINLSATSLSTPEVTSYLQQVLASSDFPTNKIIFEITETAAIESYGAAQDFIREIRRHGCKFSLDDFGSGFTSYAHLKNLRTDALKIDGSFVKDMLLSPSDHAMVKSMNDIGHSLGLLTVAEYVESPMILEALRQIGVDYAQGYAIHRPCPIDEIMAEQAA